MAATSIEWTDHSVNPIRFGKGHYCQKISSGCANCYASGLQHRFGNPEFLGTSSKIPMIVKDECASPGTPSLWLDEKKLMEVMRRRKPTKYFWCDMTDMFGSWVPDEWLDKIFATMLLEPQHTHQVLTKRPERMLSYFRMVEQERDMQRWLNAASEIVGERLGHDNFERGLLDWPLRQIWLGVSVENQQAADERIPLLLKIPAAVRFLSCEPLLGSVNLDLDRYESPGWYEYRKNLLHWVIVGGESGPGARHCNVAWVRSIVRQCKSASVPCFVKQLGGNFSNADSSECARSSGKSMQDRKGGNPDEWPADLRVREFPTSALTPTQCA